MTSYALASLVVFVLGGVCFARLGMQSRASAERRRLTCICFIAMSLVVSLSAISPDFARLHFPSNSVLSIPVRSLVVPSPNALPAPKPADFKVPFPAPDASKGPSPHFTAWDAEMIAVFGSVLVTLWWLTGLFAIVRLFVRARPAGIELQRLTSYQVRVSDALTVPISLGWPFRTVLMPADVERLELRQVELIVRHEEAHIVHRDHFWITCGYVLCAFAWFNPMAWAMLARFRHEAEIAADDAVLAAGCRASAYAELLIGFQKAAHPPLSPMPALTLLGRSGLASRVRAVLSTTRERIPMNRNKKVKSVIATAAIGLILATLVGARQVRPQSQPLKSPGMPGETRNIELVQVGMKEDSGRVVVWDPSGNPVPADEVIQHPWRSKDVDKDGVVSRYRHVIFRVQAKPGDADPETCVGSPKTNSPGEADVATGFASSDYMFTKNGWHYFDDHLSQMPWGKHMMTFDAKGNMTSSEVGRPAVKDFGLGHFKPTNLGVAFMANRLKDAGSVKNVTGDSFKLSVGKTFPPSFQRDWKDWTEIRFDIDCSNSNAREFRVITSDGRTLPDDDVLGSFTSGSSDIHNVHMMYIVNAPIDQIADMRMLTRPSFSTDLLNVPLSPNQPVAP